MEKFWKPDLKDWKEVDTKSLEFILDQASQYAAHTREVSKRITERAYSLILFIFPLTSVCVLALTLPDSRAKITIGLVFMSYAIATNLCVCLLFLFQLIFPRFSMSPGRKPRDLANKSTLEIEGYSHELTHKLLILTQITNLEEAINFNETHNNKRLKKIRIVMTILTFMLITIIISLPFFLNYNLVVSQ